jgi:hypothetical protein
MRRLFWAVLGATAGVLVMRKVNQTVQAYTPEGISRSLSNVAAGLHDLADVVREGMAEREEELRVALSAGTDDPAPPAREEDPFPRAASAYRR